MTDFDIAWRGKPTILMLPSWWPTEVNPVAGIFFKEQMEAISCRYNFIVFRYLKKRIWAVEYLVRMMCGKTITLSKEIESDSVGQYACTVYEPLSYLFSYFINIIKVKLHIIRCENGVGEYVSKRYLNKLTKKFKGLFVRFNQRIDLVYGLTAQDMAIQTFSAARALNVPYVLGEHGPFPWPGHVINNLQKYCMEKADAHFVISNDKIRQIMLQNIKPRNIHYVGNFVDENFFRCAPVTHIRKTFIIVAANSFYKNYDMFIDTMNCLSEITVEDFAVVIAGFGANRGYSKNADDLILKVQNSKFAKKTELIPSVSRSEMPCLLNRCDAFVMTSIQEGQPVSAIEAACCGLPIFSTRCGGVEDYVTEEIGRLVPITDSCLLASHLKNFLEGRITFDRQYIRNAVVRKFGHDVFVQKTSSVFDDLINREGEN